MAAIGPRRIPNVVAGLTLFWAGVLSVLYPDDAFNFPFLVPWAAALFAGIYAAGVASDEWRENHLKRLKYRFDLKLPVEDPRAFENAERGVRSSLGPPPFAFHPLPRHPEYAYSVLRAHSPPELAGTDILDRMLGKHLGKTARAKRPAHAALFDAIAQTLLAPEHVATPAGIDRHGGRSLVTHTLLVTALMMHRAPAYFYIPHGFSPVDPDFKLDPLDPLIPLIGMAHDLGKIRCMTYSEDGVAVSLKRGHEAMALRELALMPEYWDATFNGEERWILQIALAYAGNVDQAPIQPGKREGEFVVTSDRLHALMGLLGECDRLASSIEMGASYSFAAQALPLEALPAESAKPVETVDLTTTLARYMLMKMLINARSGQRSVGFKRSDEAFCRGRHVVIVDEKEFADSFAAFMGRPELAQRDKKSAAITKAVLQMLGEKGYLFRLGDQPEDATRAATSCLYKVEFWDPSLKEEDAPGLTLSSAFVIDVTDWPELTKLHMIPDCQWTPRLAGYRMGRQYGKEERRSAADDVVSEAVTGEVRPVGMDLESPLKWKKPRRSKSIEKVQAVRRQINWGIESGLLKPAAKTDTAYAFLGQERAFQEMGLEIKLYDELPDLHKCVGVLSIKKSVKNPDALVTVLSIDALSSKYIN